MSSIKFESVSVNFPVYSVNARSLKKQFLQLTMGGKLSSGEQNSIIIQALDNISFHLEHGDRVGLLGHNGSGKSTLLRVLAKIYEPSQGSVQVNGKISPLLDVMLGIDPESTGFENIILRGILLGLTRKEIDDKIDEISEFTELGNYLSMPIRTYSAGMRLRLAFAVATSISPDILLLDEIVGAGDAGFMIKAEQRMNQLIEKSSIVVLASHSMEVITKICNKAIVLKAGQLHFFGPVDQALEVYN